MTDAPSPDLHWLDILLKAAKLIQIAMAVWPKVRLRRQRPRRMG